MSAHDSKRAETCTDLKEDFAVREYQSEILEKAIKENVIVFLPTGSGKTFIAVLLIKHYLSDIKPLYSEKGKRVFFLVNTAPLVRQQAEAIRNLLPVKVGEYTGEMGVDFWKEDRWFLEQDKHNVLVMTAQIYLDMLLSQYTNVAQACLLIFDECHHAVNNHPMRQIMVEIKKLCCEPIPKIFGLTATLLNSNVSPNKLQTEVETLEATFQSRVVRALNEEMVLQYSTNPVENVLYYGEENELPFQNLISDFLQKVEDILNHFEAPSSVIVETGPPGAMLINDLDCKALKKARLGLKDSLEICRELGLYGADVSLLMMIISLEHSKLLTSNNPVFRMLCFIETGCHLIRKKFSKYLDVEPSDKPLKHCTQKVAKLVDLLKLELKKKSSDNFRILVFVDRRSTASALYHIFEALSLHVLELKDIKSNYVVGTNRAVTDIIDRENVLIRKRNKDILKKFNLGEFNLLFASNVVEEGLDVKTCNMVIKFDMPVTFRSYIQSKGRARSSTSKYIIFSSKLEKTKFSNLYAKFINTERNLKSLLCEKREVLNNEPIDDDDDRNFETFNSHGSKVTALTSISLINRYCALLPQDQFTRATCLWWVKEVFVEGAKHYIGYLRLPPNSSVKGFIEGIPRKNIMSAKRLVALEACTQLDKKGEFDAHFLPFGSRTNWMSDTGLFPNWDLDFIKKAKNRNNKKHLFDKHYSEWECNSHPKPGEDVFLHVIKIIPKFEYSDNVTLEAYYNLLLCSTTFGILTTQPWPELPAFNLFMNVGEVDCEIVPNCSFLILTKENITCLQNFHKLLFTDAVSLFKENLVMNPNFHIDDYLIAPIVCNNEEYGIDWDTVKSENKFPEIKPKPFGTRLEEPVTEERYNLKVVIPWYREENYKLKYVVTKVRTDLTPDSPFPSQSFKSYADYFAHRHNQKIYDHTQPLLEVRAISRSINCLLPRAEYNSKRQKKGEDEFEETLIPELCYRLSFPSVYLVKVTLLPSILHRVHHLFLAEELRRRISNETQLGHIELPVYTRWKELKTDKLALNRKDLNEGLYPESSDPTQPMINSSVDEVDNGPADFCEEEPLDMERNLNVDLTGVLQFFNYISKPVSSLEISIKISSKEEVDNANSTTAFEQVSPIKLIEPKIPEITSNSDQMKSQRLEPLKTIHGSYPGLPKTYHSPELIDILEALTSASSNDVINYERAELLGDSFLKFSVSLALFTKFPEYNEGKLTHIKGQIVGNLNLFFCGQALNLPGIIKVNPFEYNDWKVPCFSLSPNVHKYFEDPNLDFEMSSSAHTNLKLGGISDLNVFSESSKTQANVSTSTFQTEGNGINLSFDDDSSDEESFGCRKVQNSSSKNEYFLKHIVPEKVVSDTVESLLSVYVQSFGVEGGFTMLNWMGILPKSEYCTRDILDSNSNYPVLSSDNALLPNLNLLEESLGYTFNNKILVLEALTHLSSNDNVSDCYQRLEFLGDAILDFLLTSYIFETYTDMNPGDMTDLRSALVNNMTFACFTVKLRFHTHILHESYKLIDNISRFVRYQEGRNHEISQDVIYLISEEDAEVAECVDAPKALGDIFESLMAAVYLDSGKNLNTVWAVVYNIMENEIKNFAQNIPKNPVRMLYETFPTQLPKFGKPEVKGDYILIPLEVVHEGKSKMFFGRGFNKYAAKVAASKLALKFYKIN